MGLGVTADRVKQGFCHAAHNTRRRSRLNAFRRIRQSSPSFKQDGRGLPSDIESITPTGRFRRSLRGPDTLGDLIGELP